MSKLCKFISIGLLGLTFTGYNTASAQQLNSPKQIDTVYTFSQICYKLVPNVEAIKTMALELGWKPLGVSDLKAFGDKASLKQLMGWDVQVGEKFYRLGLTQGPISEKTKQSFEGFENGVSTSCTMVLDGSDENAKIALNMQTLAGKAAVSKDVPDGDLLTTTWAGGNDDFKVFLFNKASTDQDGGLLNVTIISKN